MICLEIPRCGCTTLKTLAYRHKYNQDYSSDIPVHYFFGYEENETIKPWYYREKDRIKFCVVRDPVERSISTYKTFTKISDRWNLKNPSFKKWINFVSENLKKERQDVHIRRQIDFFEERDIDYIVKLEDLNSFLENFGYINIPQKLASSKGPKTNIKIKKKYKNKLKKIYEDDYNIFKSEKIWRKTK